MTLDKTWYNALVNDDGSNALGTVWNKERIAELLATVDAIQEQCCQLTTSLALSWGTGVWAKVGFQVENFDPKNMHAANDTEVWMPGPGTYNIQARVTWPESNVGWRGMQLVANDITILTPPGYLFTQPQVTGLGVGTMQQLSVLYYAAAMTRLSLHLFQNSGAPQVIPVGLVSLGVFRIS